LTRPPNSSKIPVLTVLLDICGYQGQATVPEVEEGLRNAGHDLDYAAVSMALMRYAKLGLISRTRDGRMYHYTPNMRTEASLEFLKRSEAVKQEIDAKIQYLGANILAGDISPSRGQALALLLTTGPDMEVVPERTKRILTTLGMSVAMLPPANSTGEGSERAKNLLDQVMNQIGKMIVLHDYSKSKISAVLEAIMVVRLSIEKELPQDAKYLTTIYLLLDRIQKGNLNA
jgi:predicted transcriptional regulator